MKKKYLPNQTKSQIVKFVQLKSRMDIHDLAKDLGVTFWALYLTLKRTSKNNVKNPLNIELRTKIANRLGVAYDDLWGPNNQQKIKELIEKEIKVVVVEQALEYQKKLEKRMMIG